MLPSLKYISRALVLEYKYQEDNDIISLIDTLLLKLDKITEKDFKNIDFSLSLLDEPNID